MKARHIRYILYFLAFVAVGYEIHSVIKSTPELIPYYFLEEGLLENLQPMFLFFASFTFLLLALMAYRARLPWAFYLVFGIVTLILAFEEKNWGQGVFFQVAQNSLPGKGDEMSFRLFLPSSLNLKSFMIPLYFLWGFYLPIACAIFPALRKWVSKVHLPVPTLFLITGMAIAFLLKLEVMNTFTDLVAFPTFFQEIYDIYIYMTVAFCSIEQFVSFNAGLARRKVLIPLRQLWPALIFLAILITGIWMSHKFFMLETPWPPKENVPLGHVEREFLVLEGNLARVRGDNAIAYSMLTRASQGGYRDSKLWVGLGIVNTKSGRINDAVTSYNNALAANPGEVDAYIGLARIYYNNGDLERTKETLKKALQYEPDNQEIQTFMRLPGLGSPAGAP